ncbi:hypothetical protein BME96_16555 [Virgibacillus halodenitrificans]|uniref:Uncharacterized protein n=1 Tax=Virgibacillus halodenitrificans TaxID=1482 RepID=A0AAC9J2U4_VIRHA|nr:hypothetical protein BME96_16555 [Virgibacillus halodenitrificans]
MSWFEWGVVFGCGGGSFGGGSLSYEWVGLSFECGSFSYEWVGLSFECGPLSYECLVSHLGARLSHMNG